MQSSRSLRSRLASATVLTAVVTVLALLSLPAPAHNGAHGQAPAVARPADAEPVAPLQITVPDVAVIDQDGRKHRFGTDLIGGRTVLVNFIFTSCTSVCSPLTAIVKTAREQLAAAGRGDVQVVSVSVDPLNDTPERLRAYAVKAGAGGPNWRFVTGSRTSIDAILKGFGVPVGGNLDAHTPMVFVGRGTPLRWTRAYGLAGPAAIVERVTAEAGLPQRPQAMPAPALPGLVRVGTAAAASPSATVAANGPAVTAPAVDAMRSAAAQHAAGARPQRLGAQDAASYFTNLPVLTHDRGRVRFYDDLIKGRVVLVHAFFAGCRDVCSPVAFNLAQAQQRLAALPGAVPVQIVSLSVDPVADTPELLRSYAERHGAGPGWSFVTGKKENVDWVLDKLGLYAPEKEQHQAALWIGNDRNQTWVKLHALAPPDAIVAAVRKVL